MSRLDDWYGPQKAAQIRREQARRMNPRVSYRGFGSAASVGHGAAAGGVAGAKPLTGEGADKLSAAMDKAVLSLRAAILAAKANAAARPGTLTATGLSVAVPFLAPLLQKVSTPDEVKEAVLNGLTQMDGLVDLRLVQTKQDVLDGKLAADKWFSNVENIRDGVQSILKELADSSTSALLSKNIDDTKQMMNDAAEWLKKTGQKAALVGGGLGVVALVVGAGVLVVAWPLIQNVLQAYATAPLRALPPRQVSGYRRRRK